MSSYNLSIIPTTDPFPFAALVLASYIKESVGVEFTFEGTDGPCVLTRTADATRIDEAESVVRALSKAAGMESGSTQGEAIMALSRSIPTTKDFAALVASLDSLDDRLALRTYLDGRDLTVVDWLVWGAIKGSLKPLGIMKGGKHPHLLRWYTHIESLPTTEAALADLAAARSRGARAKGGVASSFGLGLENAEMGKVVTRFPPEPSGYMHIGHLKAAVLNQYFAEMYKGKLLIRFDDTNPTKEKSEFEDTILEDLAVLNIKGDKISHTSDHFDLIFDYALKLIKDGKAYVDDTDQEQMKIERTERIPSRYRDMSVEETLKRFQWMKEGTPEGLKSCLRAKIDYKSDNGTLRDPVIYRGNPDKHHRTGDKWKIYPNYDFACPVVDSYEGVTHALRSDEYRERNVQYQWFLGALKLRKVHVWEFSRISFVYTFLSKRKLRSCIELGLARGWDDPRFPTFRGIRRRGMTTEALRQFMLSQGPSKNQVDLEWDSIWTLNKKIIDPIAPRFVAVATDKMVTVTLNGAAANAEVKTMPLHKKNPDVGEKKTVFSNTVVIEQEDALSFADNEEITLMDWGNAIVRSVKRSSSGDITDIAMDLHLAGDFKATEKKITWLSKPSSAHSLVPVTLLDYDYLITKRKLGENDTLEQVANRQTEFSVEAFADANVTALKKGDIIQFERKGYYILDRQASDGKEGNKMEFISIPDGRAAGLALKASAPADGAVAPLKKTAAGSAKTDEGVKMYKVDAINSGAAVEVPTGMYKVDSVYE